MKRLFLLALAAGCLSGCMTCRALLGDSGSKGFDGVVNEAFLAADLIVVGPALGGSLEYGVRRGVGDPLLAECLGTAAGVAGCVLIWAADALLASAVRGFLYGRRRPLPLRADLPRCPLPVDEPPPPDRIEPFRPEAFR